MAKSRAESKGRAAPPLPSEPALGGYYHWARDPAVGLFAVLPLWLLYEGLRLSLVPSERNGAEVLLLRELQRVGPYGLLVVRVLLGVLMVVAARSLVRRQVPWLRVAAVLALEGTVYGLLLGPIAGNLAASAARVLAVAVPGDSMVANLVGSLGAGIFEELVFRLGLMSALVWIGMRAVRAWALPAPVAAGIVGSFAVVVSAVVFSWFHHFCGEAYDPARFLYRTVAGVLLGVLMWARGFGVCVYTHAFYDLHYYLTH
ncbi:MAG: CPBP family intramembrane metalloprotease [Planctomycetes bacterium]|nr:CPBP family intramembrane metalloprotease [Planctomycetota bacterium]